MWTATVGLVAIVAMLLGFFGFMAGTRQQPVPQEVVLPVQPPIYLPMAQVSITDPNMPLPDRNPLR